MTKKNKIENTDIVLEQRNSISLKIVNDSSGKKWNGYTFYGNDRQDGIKHVISFLAREGYDLKSTKLFVRVKKEENGS